MKRFEERLAELPLNPPPADWRDAILAAAAAEEGKRKKIVPFPAFLRRHPVVWGALAACWLVIAFLNFSGPGEGELHLMAKVPERTPSAAQMAEYFERRQLLLRWPTATDTAFKLDRSKL
jgi:hypothetical protein